MKTSLLRSIFFLILGIIFLSFWTAGSHGHIAFRPYMLEDWVLTALTMFSFALSFFFVFKSIKKK